MKRNNKRMKWKACKKCGLRIYLHRPDSHICMEENQMKECTDCGKKVENEFIVKGGSYKGQCTDCANANCQDDKRSFQEDGR